MATAKNLTTAKTFLLGYIMKIILWWGWNESLVGGIKILLMESTVGGIFAGRGMMRKFSVSGEDSPNPPSRKNPVVNVCYGL